MPHSSLVHMIHRLHLFTTNAYLALTERGAFLIDSGLPKDWSKLLRLIRSHGVDPRDIKAVLHTHGHSDHAGNSKRLRDEFQIPLVLHRLELDRVQRGDNGPLVPNSWMSPFARPFVHPHFPGFTPDLIVESDDLGVIARTFDFPGEVLYTPGHSAGSLTYILGKEAIVGDIVRGSIWPWVQRGASHFFHADAERAQKSVRDVLARGVERLYPGHFTPVIASRMWMLLR